ncbi:ABC transporter substrate-binding protein [Saccharibacillus sp. CPCC 101409]|uniref:ABC transporter substrate-binding protein n=1 Tax=Saccharibacillus sp. CPCC 101409 TaxID=3058041 RepID=UPI0026724A0C|nr:ABC transporter substrate-binding protein [Saccharibacillus sp. CPCC 101409]MDO3410263.1 ABC transporter substrate-binding protein [Saccharibacillus sp. CPCC 101409]
MFSRFSYSSFSIVRRTSLPLALCALTLTVGCSAGAPAAQPRSSAGSDSDAAQTTQDAKSPAAASRVVKHLGGETTITGTPQRIAVLDYRLADSLSALGLKPYAMNTYLGDTQLPYMDADALAGVQPLGDETNLEAVLAAKPDLIIAREPDLEKYDQLTAIAPTLVVGNPAQNWKSDLLAFGDMLERRPQAEEWIANYEAKAADVRADIDKVVPEGSTFLYLRVLPKEIRVHAPDKALAEVLNGELKLAAAKGVEKIDNIEAISLEVLPDFDADYIFMQVGFPEAEGDDDAKQNLSRIQQSSIWQNLKAVKAGHVYEVPHWAISDYPNIKDRSLDLVREALTGADRE